MVPTIHQIREMALQLGWDDAGITSAKISEENIRDYLAWLENGMNADLSYMENRIRIDPDSLLPGAKTAIIFVSNYKKPKQPFSSDYGIIASYARGRDYHRIHRKRLKKFIAWLEGEVGKTGIAKGFSDSSPVLEKALAVQAGLGWFGKNTLLIHRRFGTFTLLSGLFTTIEFPDLMIHPRLPRCGVCTKCLDACPTQALIKPYQLDAAKCLSYHLIESKKEIPPEIVKQNPGYIFGCDICQDACPHNIRSPFAENSDFSVNNEMESAINWEIMGQIEENPEKLHGTPLQRRKVEGLKYNLKLLNKKG